MSARDLGGPCNAEGDEQVKKFTVSRRGSYRIAAAGLAAAGALGLTSVPAHADNTYLEHVWANSVNVHMLANPAPCAADPGTYCVVLGQVNAGDIYVYCQEYGESVTFDGYQSNYWSMVYTSFGVGWISNVFLNGPAQLPGVPSCN